MAFRCVLVCGALFLAGIAAAEASAVATWAAKQEAGIAEQVAQETYPLRKVQKEYLLRRDYAFRLVREQETRARSGKIRTPEVEALRARQAELMKQVEQLDREIVAAAMKAPEIVELQTVAEENEKRISELFQAIEQIRQAKAAPGKRVAPEAEKGAVEAGASGASE